VDSEKGSGPREGDWAARREWTVRRGVESEKGSGQREGDWTVRGGVDSEKGRGEPNASFPGLHALIFLPDFRILLYCTVLYIYYMMHHPR
jgi:hypothetical protein